jgi:RimJ/RimL family protein N-acetyltransferase
MLAEAGKSARTAGITNVTWVQGNSADLPGDFGRFLLVTMGRSFHWMDREQVLTALDAIVDYDGAVVLANDSCPVRPSSPWQQAVEDIQYRFLPADSVPPTPLPGRMNSPADHQPHEQILARSAFRHVDRRVYEFERPWAVDQVIGYLYSTSLPLRRLLGDRLPVFEQEITDTLNMFRQRWHVRRADSVDEASQWIRAWQSGWADESQLNWALVDRASDLLLGRMSLKAVDLHDGSGGLAYWVVPASRGRALLGSRNRAVPVGIQRSGFSSGRAGSFHC